MKRWGVALLSAGLVVFAVVEGCGGDDETNGTSSSSSTSTSSSSGTASSSSSSSSSSSGGSSSSSSGTAGGDGGANDGASNVDGGAGDGDGDAEAGASDPCISPHGLDAGAEIVSQASHSVTAVSCGIAVDDTYVYWAMADGRRVQRALKSGSAATQITLLTVNTERCGTIATDGVEVFLGSNSALWGVPIDGGERRGVNAGSIDGISLDSNRLYVSGFALAWTEKTTNAPYTELDKGFQFDDPFPFGRDFVVDGTHVWYVGRTEPSDGSIDARRHHIMRIPKNGGAPREVMFTQPGGIGAFAVASGSVYFVDVSGIKRWQISSGAAGVPVQVSPANVVHALHADSDSDNVYFYDKPSTAVYRLNAACPTPVFVANEPSEVDAFTSDATHVYWTTRNAKVARIAK